MARMMLRDDQWERIEGFLQGKVGDPGRHGADNRLFVEAVLWIARTGGPWRDLPGEFGPWNSVYVRFARWSDKDVWQNVFAVLREDADFEEVFLDSTIVRAHQHAAGAAKKKEQALGRSKGGLSTKIHACVEGLGQLARFILTGGQVNDITQAQALIVEIDAAAFLADKAYDADALLACIASKNAKAIIPPRKNRKEQRKFDRHQYRNRNLIERFFAQLKQFRRVATRYDKLASRFGSFVALVASLLWLK
ncbi:IS5 family transposase [Undibacterium arcticum]|uniref:IS5 family transposase n=1 Tax=Undibacterium arcticum TaxID=1762892 RepID=A0ABV7EZG6_9BURK